MIVQTKCIQTILYDNGKLSHYRSTFPLPKEYALANYVREPYRKLINKTWYYIGESKDFDGLYNYINKLQISVRRWKMIQLNNQIKSIQLNLNYGTS